MVELYIVEKFLLMFHEDGQESMVPEVKEADGEHDDKSVAGVYPLIMIDIYKSIFNGNTHIQRE